jgi:phytoene desaturase
VHPLLVGGHPFRTSAIYALIHHLELAHGVHYVRGGTYNLVLALERTAKKLGVRFEYGAEVQRFEMEGRRVAGLTLGDGKSVHADIFVSNLDPAFMYRALWPGTQPRRRWSRAKLKRQRLSMGLYVIYFATDIQYPDVAHHTIVLGEGFRPQLNAIFDGDKLPETFSAYLHRPKATDSTAAPDGVDAFYVLVPVPNLRSDIDWLTEEPDFRNVILQFLEQRLLPGLNANLRFAFSVTPQYFSEQLQSEAGAGFSAHPNLTQSAWFRFHNKSEEADNLYLVGAGTHPGAGVPGVLTSARVLDHLIPAPADVSS